MEIAYVQPIFCPNLDMLGRNIISINSFYNYYDKMGYGFECIFGGYCATDELWNSISELIINRSGGKSIPIRFTENYGKAYVVNKLVGELDTEVTHILTADSDIIFKIDEIDIVDRLFESFNYANRINLNPSLIALFQEENNCHMLELCYANQYYYDGKYQKEMICKPSVNGGIAGGCLCILKEFWDLIGGYEVIGVYAGEDGMLMKKACALGYSILLSNSIRCIHPNETNIEYKKWKILNCTNVVQYDVSMKQANSFWDK